MRRVLLFAAFLLLLGLTTAFAASLDVQAEDITSFSTPVSISVPDPPVVPGSFFLRGDNGVLPGILDDEPTGSDPVRTKEVKLGTLGVKAQTQTDHHHSWETGPAPAGGIQLNGPAVLRIYQNGGPDRITAALFDCASGAATDTGCVQITVPDRVSADDGLTGVAEHALSFGNVVYTIPENRRLRVQIVNFQHSTAKWNVQWGFKSNRPSRLDVTFASP